MKRTNVETSQEKRGEDKAGVVPSLAREHTLLGIKPSPGRAPPLTPLQCARQATLHYKISCKIKL